MKGNHKHGRTCSFNQILDVGVVVLIARKVPVINDRVSFWIRVLKQRNYIDSAITRETSCGERQFRNWRGTGEVLDEGGQTVGASETNNEIPIKTQFSSLERE